MAVIRPGGAKFTEAGKIRRKEKWGMMVRRRFRQVQAADTSQLDVAWEDKGRHRM